ncbi:MAG TPA: hypothetical protein PLX60_13995 [Chitinophagales bacterium]|nr:hypothetical protein [Chitinophagales bacterium]
MILEHYLTVENFWKLVPILISSYTLVIVLQNRRSKIREMLYEKQYNLLLQLNQKIIDIEVEIQILRKWIEKKDYIEIEDSKIRYTDNLKNIVSQIQLEGNLILPKNIIKSSLDIVTLYMSLLPDILNTSKELESNEIFNNRIKEVYLWQNTIREHVGIEKLSDENKKIIG